MAVAMKRKIGVLFFGLIVAASAQHKEYEQPAAEAARGTHAAVAAGSEYATEAGMRMYYHGGNAVDAGVAAMYAASVSEFSHFGFGGEAPILIRTKAGKVIAIAGVGPMPKLATAKMFRERRPRPGEILTLDPGGLKGIIPVAGIMPALVPSMVESGLVALRDYGTKSFNEVIQPAIELADGLAIDEMRSQTIARSRRFFDLWPDSKKTFMPDGKVPMTGEIFHQPNLARTLRSMAAAEKKALAAGASRTAAIDAVRDYFYRGEIAHRIDAFMKENDGLLRYEDMAAFKLEPEEPVSTDFQGVKVYKPGFWSQGPAMIETLNILEGFDLRALGYNSADYIHKSVEALKLAYADRDAYYGDPKFNPNMPMDVLLSKSYAAERRKLIGKTASLDFIPGTINGKTAKHPVEMDIARTKIDDELMESDTTCVDAIDKDGIMFSATPSGAWLPSVIAGDTGIPLTERAQQFILVPGSPNELAGGKRPRVTLSPTLVTEQGKPLMVLSTPGGDNQEQSLMQVMLNVLDFHMNSQAAVEAPRYETRHLVSSFDNHAWNRGDLILDERTPPSVAAELAARGHKVSFHSKWNSGAAPVIVRVTPDGVIEAGADPYGYRSAHAY
jgi:gamma-glutamyltranspeptidase/glutathione hydrolase